MLCVPPAVTCSRARLKSSSFVRRPEPFVQTRLAEAGGEACQLMPLRNANNNMKSLSENERTSASVIAIWCSNNRESAG